MARSLYMERDQAQALVAVAVAAASAKIRGTSKTEFIRLHLYGKQNAIVEDDSQFTMTEATTKAGKTMSHLEWWLEAGIRAGEGNWWWCAPSAVQARIAFERAKNRLNGYIEKPLPDGTFARVKVAEPIPFRYRATPEMEIECCGARFSFRTAEKPDLLYGDDVRGVVCDEITRWREAAWVAVYTTLVATRGRAKLIGNVKGRKNFAYKLARKAEHGEPGWGYHRLTAYDAAAAGLIAYETIEQAKRDLTEEQFKELFLAEAAMDTGNPFGDLTHCIAPMSSRPVASWGVDLAKSVDWTVMHGLDANGHTAGFERWQKTPWRATTERILRHLQTTAYVDSTGVGDPIVEDLQAARGDLVTGFKFTSQSKQQLMEGLALAIQSGRVFFPEGVITAELEAFEYTYTRLGVKYSAPEGMHDDCVCALALAVSAQRDGLRFIEPENLLVPEEQPAPWQSELLHNGSSWEDSWR